MLSIEQPEWDISFCDALERILEPAYSAPHVVVDMSAVTYIDSTCLAKLARMRKIRSEHGFAPARLVIVSAHLKRLFRIVQFDRIWPLYDSLEDALKTSDVYISRWWEHYSPAGDLHITQPKGHPPKC
ncbi:MAG: STAS domain-containing protein [Candidatus Eremiobacteraeota bacterium]|nr:STAS domain-containing protein [Candidatus Eremiobacteraeota bacterium]